MTWRIASVSWGKDSLAMLHLMIEDGHAPDEVVFYDTGAEFDAIYVERDRTLPLLAEHGIKYTELRPRRPFFFDMLAKTVHKRDGSTQQGYGWCGGPCRWGTTEKTRALDRYAERKNAIVYVGIAADEERRLAKRRKPYKRFPLADRGLTEADCLELCRAHGATWEQDGVCLYDVLDRVSCWCCRNKNQRELRAIHDHLPNYWQRLLALESRLGTMKSKPLPELAARWEEGR